MRTITTTAYACGFCTRRRFTKRAIERHEQWCQCRTCAHFTPEIVEDDTGDAAMAECAAGRWDEDGYSWGPPRPWHKQPVPCPDRAQR